MTAPVGTLFFRETVTWPERLERMRRVGGEGVGRVERRVERWERIVGGSKGVEEELRITFSRRILVCSVSWFIVSLVSSLSLLSLFSAADAAGGEVSGGVSGGVSLVVILRVACACASVECCGFVKLV